MAEKLQIIPRTKFKHDERVKTKGFAQGYRSVRLEIDFESGARYKDLTFEVAAIAFRELDNGAPAETYYCGPGSMLWFREGELEKFF